ncbi:MAG TPA: hypothetical protein VFN35_10435, partial [Ktedonobacteraceae bacterium]|nr:hypothetical protein [Ktedonobacteraceae bacterium]
MENRINQSEVARLLSSIETEYLAARHGLTDFAVVAKHQAITARMENMGRLYEQLRTLIGDDAIRLATECLD